MLEVLTPAAGSDLVELEAVKRKLGLASTDTTKDQLLADLITEGSAEIVDYFGEEIARAQYQETMFGTDRDLLVLSRRPVELGLVTATIAGTAVTDFSVHDAEAGLLFREDLWPRDADPDVVVTYYAGYLLPGRVSSWKESTAYAAGAWVRPGFGVLSPFRMECTTAGTSGSSQPTWPTTVGDTVTDGTAVWAARAARELPAQWRAWAYLAARHLLDDRPAGLISSRVGDVAEAYSRESADGSPPLPVAVRLAIDRHRRRM
jgi:hypothetical protein